MIIVKYTKLGNFKYLSFLDIRNAFLRTLNRAKITTSFSQGFNPHNLVYFCDPDSLGISSQSDYALIDTECEAGTLLETFNAHAPEGLSILLSKKVSKKITFNKIFKFARYKIVYNGILDIEKLTNLLTSSVMIASKVTDNGVRTFDIKPKFHSFEIIDNISLYATISYGQEKLSPSYLINYIASNLNLKEGQFSIIKENIYSLENGQLIDVDNIF